jgi:hypothetical protein
MPNLQVVHSLIGSNSFSGFIDAITLADGTVWSHAAVLGEFDHPGFGHFTIDEKKLREFVTNFETGYPSKVPVDYDHGTTNGIADGSNIVRKAGDIVEMKAVLSETDMTPEIKAVVDKYNARREELKVKSVKPNPFGLWVRWLPNPRGLATVNGREYTEMSISFVDQLEDKNGKTQGATILAVALTNSPFLDDMIPIAASRPGGSAAGSAKGDEHVSTNRLLLALSVLAGKSIETDDDAVNELTSLRSRMGEVNSLTDFRTRIAAEFAGETSPDKIVAAVKELRTKVTTAETKEKDALKKGALARAETIVKAHESKLIVPEREHYKTELAKELETGVDEKESTIVKLLEAKTGLKLLNTQSSAVDTGKGIDEDTAIAAKAEELKLNDPEVKALMASDPNRGTLRALSKAAEQVRGKKAVA